MKPCNVDSTARWSENALKTKEDKFAKFISKNGVYFRNSVLF